MPLRNIRDKIRSKTSALYQKVSQPKGRVEEQIHVGPGISTEYRDRSDPSDIEYPPLGLDYAFDYEVNVKGVFFRRDGEWCIWRNSVNCIDKRRNTPFEERLPHWRIKDREYPSIDKPKPNFIRWRAAHKSEGGWNLGWDNPRHLFKFLQEILNHILRYVLVAPNGVTLSPVFKDYHHTTYDPIFEYRISGGVVLPDINSVTQRDSQGFYIAYRKIYRAAIDATCLRACKKLYNSGIALLYSNNLSFCTHSAPLTHMYSRHEADTESIEEKLITPSKDRAKLRSIVTEVETEHYFEDYVDELRNNRRSHRNRARALVRVFRNWYSFLPIGSRPHLRDWTQRARHFDTFMWFIWTIGTENAAMVKSLRFFSLDHDDDLQIFSCYIPFMKVLCTRLEKLRIDTGWPETQIHWFGDRNSDRSRALINLLHREIRDIKSLRGLQVLNVIRTQHNERNSFHGRDLEHGYGESVPEYAEKTIAWIDRRAKERRRADRISYAKGAARKERERLKACNLKESLTSSQGVEKNSEACSLCFKTRASDV